MQGQVLYAPIVTPSQDKAARRHEQFQRDQSIRRNASLGAQDWFAQAWTQLTQRHNHRGELRLEVIKRAICEHFNVSRLDIESSRRTNNVVRPRQIAMWFCRELTTRSLPEIGKTFGGRDHTTALHAIRTIDAMRITDAKMQSDIDAIKFALTGETPSVQP